MDWTKLEIKRLARKLIDDRRIDFIEGCRKIAQLSNCLNSYDTDKNILVIRGVSSQSDRFPSEKVRDICSPKHLVELDLEKGEFTACYKESVINSCQSIIESV